MLLHQDPGFLKLKLSLERRSLAGYNFGFSLSSFAYQYMIKSGPMVININCVLMCLYGWPFILKCGSV